MADATGEQILHTLRRNGRRIIDRELSRLVRRTPALRAQDIAAIDHTLEQVLDRLVVDRVRRVGVARPELLESAGALCDPATSVTLPARRVGAPAGSSLARGASGPGPTSAPKELP